MPFHTSVLVKEIINLFSPTKDSIYIDGTLGHGGHSEKLLTKGATIIGLDQDPESLQVASKRLNKFEKFSYFQDNFINFYKYLPANKNLDGILLDLGLNMQQQKSTSLGFSFDSDNLDMQLDPNSTLTAKYVINTFSQEDLFNIFAKISQEKYSTDIAKAIVNQRKHRPIQSAKELTELVQKVYLTKNCKTKLNPATKILMALRIYVNQEQENLEIFLENTIKFCPKNCTIAIITFHSGEDRIIKKFFNKNKQFFQVNKAIFPSRTEVHTNPSSRSAILRSATKMI